jgi:site-specific DNA-cytosine methylase
LDRLERVGNAVVPQLAEYIGQCILHAHHEQRGDA